MWLAEHHRRAKAEAERVSAALFPDDGTLRSFLGTVADVHDEGKASPIWQRFACNNEPDPVAKSDCYRDAKTLSGFRHEWKSLSAERAVKALDRLLQDVPAEDSAFYQHLFCHLIGTHHGYLRPNLPDQPSWQNAALDPARLDAVLRWHELQEHLGPWRLAYLEALLKAADSLASRTDEELAATPEED